MPPDETAGAPELTARQRLDLRIVSVDGVHALRTQLDAVLVKSPEARRNESRLPGRFRACLGSSCSTNRFRR